jgi:hypothetical protein
LGRRLENCHNGSPPKITFCFRNFYFHPLAWHNIGHKDHTTIVKPTQSITTGN